MTIQKQNTLQKPLLASLLGIGFGIIVTTSFGREAVKYVTDIMYILVTAVFVIVTLSLTLRFRKTGDHGKAWFFFLFSAISWCIAETTWTVTELLFKEKPFPSISDAFYLAGYPFLFCFLIFYLKPVRKAITRKMILSSTIIAIGILIPSIYMGYSFEPDTSPLENFLATAYPIADAIIFAPALIGIVLFFRGEVNFTWSLICIGIFCFTMGDLGFEIATFTNTYYTGHPVDIVLIWAYILFSFGAYDHLKIFKKDKSVDDRTKEDSDNRF